jgi:hypothetical protein
VDRQLTHIKTDAAGWVITMTPEMVRAAGVAEGSLVVFHFKAGTVAAEIFPSPTDDLWGEVRGIADEFAGAFAEMERRGD